MPPDRPGVLCRRLDPATVIDVRNRITRQSVLLAVPLQHLGMLGVIVSHAQEIQNHLIKRKRVAFQGGISRDKLLTPE